MSSVASVDILPLHTLLGTIFPPAQGLPCEERCENGAG